MKTFLLVLSILCASIGARSVDVQMWTSFESGNHGDAVTLSGLNTGTRAIAGLGYWTNTMAIHFTVETNNYGISRSIFTGTTNSVDEGTRSVKFIADTDQSWIRYIFNANQSNISIGYWLKIDSYTNYSWTTFDLVVLGGGGEFLSFNLDDKPTTQYGVRAHSQAGGSALERLATNGLYWVSMKWAAGGNGQIALYNSNLTALSTQSIALLDRACTRLDIGRSDSHSGTNDSFFRWDNILISTNAEFPLLPTMTPTNWYVSASAEANGNGTAASPWQDITNAVPFSFPGDTVFVTNGTYGNRVTITRDGESTNRIRWIASGSRAVTKTVGWLFSGSDYNTLVGFDVSHTNLAGTQDFHLVHLSNSTGVEVIDNAIHDSETSGNAGIAVSDSSNFILRGNDIWNTVYPAAPLYTSSGAPCISLGTFNAPATNGITEYNWTSYSSDHHNGYGTNLVIRNAVMGPIDDSTEAHVDGLQVNQPMLGCLIENSTLYQSRDPGNEGVHFFLTSDDASQSVIRGGILVDGTGEFYVRDSSTNFAMYHNSVVNAQWNSSYQVEITGNAEVESRNNLWHTATTANGGVYSASLGGVVSTDYDLVYPASTGYSSTNSVEADPLLVSTNNASPDFRLGSSSPARNAAGGITFTTASGSGSSSLPVANIYRFVVGDWIYVGSAGPAKITARSAGTGTAGTYTLASSLSWSNGDPVYWSTPSGVRYADIGAIPYSASVTNLTASYSQSGTTVTATANFESRMAVLYDANGVPSDPIYAPTNYSWTASSGVSKVRVYSWFAPYDQSQRWVDAAASVVAINATTANVGTIVIR